MKKFLLRVVLFTGPILLPLMMLSYILWESKEDFYSLDALVKSKEKYLVGYAYHEDNYKYLKYSYLNSNEKKCIWALGSSRVLQFRKGMFDSSFYNAGYTISSLNDFKPFLESIPENKHPDYLLIGLDQWMFNSTWDPLNTIPEKDYWQKSFHKYPEVAQVYMPLSKDVWSGHYTLTSFHKDSGIQKIGLQAAYHNLGFRNDGSMCYGDEVLQCTLKDSLVNADKFSDTYQRIEQGNRRFEYGEKINPKALIALEHLLKYCKMQRLEVIAILPPFADTVYKTMMNSGHYAYLKEIPSQIGPLFKKYHYELYDFSNASFFQSPDYELIDGFHGGEVSYQKMMIHMLDNHSTLNKVTNADRLKTDLTKRKNHYIVYKY